MGQIQNLEDRITDLVARVGALENTLGIEYIEVEANASDGAEVPAGGALLGADRDEPETTPAQAADFSDLSEIPAGEGQAPPDDSTVDELVKAAEGDDEVVKVEGVDPLSLGRAGFDSVINSLD